MVGAALEDPQSWCGIIVDNVHAHPASLRVALAAKPRGKMFLVTDAMPPVGAESPEFSLYGEPVTVRDGRCVNAAGAVRNAVRSLGLPLAEAARMASTYPARFLGLHATHGRIAAGQRAQFVVFDDDLVLHDVIG